MGKLIDLSNQQFGWLTVLERDIQIQKEKNSRDTFWKCKCKCGNIHSVRGKDLKNGKILSCGCLKKENAHNLNFKDLTNQKFGKLTVLYQCNYNIDNHAVWHCKCECGNEKDIMGKHLLSGTTQSCGCLKSKGELKIIEILNELNIQYETQKSFENCKNVNNLKFDFFLPEKNICIEYNGIQHYKEIGIFGGQERLEYQQQNDLIKKQWCEQNNIKLIVISYQDYDKLDKNFLLNKL